jgi:hypothetical protein
VGSIPIARSLRSEDSLIAEIAAVAQLVEYVLGKDGVMGSSPISSFSAMSMVMKVSGGVSREMLWRCFCGCPAGLR